MKFALSKTRRRILLYGLTALFLIAAPFVIFYSIGIFVDLRSRTLLPTGGIFVKTNVTGAKVFLNGALAKENSFLSRGALLNDITEGAYLLRVEKERYQPWQKKVVVKNGTVSEFRNIFLIPQEPAETTVFQITSPAMAIKTIDPAAGASAVITISENEDTRLFLLDTATNQITNTDVRHVLETALSPTKQKLLIKTFAKENNANWTVADISNDEFRIIASLPQRISYFANNAAKTILLKTIKKISFHPLDENKLYLQDNQTNLFLYDTASQTANLVISNVNSFFPAQNGIFFLDKNGFLAFSDFLGKQITVLDKKGFFLTNVPSKFISSPASSALGIIDQGGGLFFLSDPAEELRMLAHDTANAAISPFSDKIAYWNRQEINILWLKDSKESPFEKSGDITAVFKTDGKETIRDAVWLDDNVHLLYLTDKRIVLSEIDPRGGILASTVIDVNANHFFYDPNGKKIYWANKNLIRSISLE
ncbi:PEGA domain-containing protein [Patescibacteria group bacterium]|nr:PEGA domain-containing protein [Patescibacteria group bacterium]